MRIRLVERRDAEAIRAIYNLEVEGGTTTFDLVTRTSEEQRQWVERHRGAHPAIVAVDDSPVVDEPLAVFNAGVGPDIPSDGPVAAFGVIAPFRNRAAYATTVESSVYVHRDYRGQGVGRAIVTELVRLAGEHGFHSVIARISGNNDASIALHGACGFELVGVEREVGRKHGRWLDLVEMQRML
jgi:L-amino acid N-acyltransferase YncA